MKERLAKSRARARGEPTVGSLGEELATNPFLRCKSPQIRASMKLDKSASEIEVFAAIRKAKDSVPRAPLRESRLY